jgi:hypothetical protein
VGFLNLLLRVVGRSCQIDDQFLMDGAREHFFFLEPPNLKAAFNAGSYFRPIDRSPGRTQY